MVEFQDTLAERLPYRAQDVLRLDNSARMNKPGEAAGNWSWQMSGGPGAWDALKTEAHDLRELGYLYQRLPEVTDVGDGESSAVGQAVWAAGRDGKV